MTTNTAIGIQSGRLSAPEHRLQHRDYLVALRRPSEFTGGAQESTHDSEYPNLPRPGAFTYRDKLTAHHAFEATFARTSAIKIIENAAGENWSVSA